MEIQERHKNEGEGKEMSSTIKIYYNWSPCIPCETSTQ